MAEEIRNYIIGIIVFTAFIMGGVALMGELRKSDLGYATDERFSEFNNTFNVYNDLDDSIGNMETGITNTNSTDYGTFGVLNSLIASSWQTLRLMFSSLDFMDNVIGGTVLFGIPSWMASLAIMAITVIIIFAIFAYIFRS